MSVQLFPKKSSKVIKERPKECVCMLNYHVKIGLAPMRRDVTPRPGIFNWEKAEERGHRIVAYIEEHFAS